MRIFNRLILSLFVALILAGCEKPVQEMGPTEYGIRFRRLPVWLGGGISGSITGPGEFAFILPWESIYRFDTSVQGVSWGSSRKNEEDARPEYVNTRALDGNEVALAVTVRYRVSIDPKSITKMIQEVATSNKEVERLVTVVSRGDIRTYMNELRTSDFLDPKARYTAIEKTKNAIANRLAPYGILIDSIILDDFRFERVLPDGTVDTSYQDKLNEIQRIREGTEREKARVETIIAKKQQEFNEIQAKVNRQVAEADGYSRQAQVKGDSYLQARSNEAKAVLAQGKAEVEGMIEKISALQGPGGRALLKLDLAKSLMKNDPKFVVMGQSNGSALDVQRVDANELIKQAGIFEGLRDKVAPTAPIRVDDKDKQSNDPKMGSKKEE